MADETPAPLSDAEMDRQIDLLIAGLEGPTITAPTYGDIKTVLRRAKRTLAALERERAAMREIVAAVATGLDGARIFEMRNRARALLDTQTPETSATAGEEGEA